jgi:hypothetical protein
MEVAPPLGTRLTTSALLLEAFFFLFPLFFLFVSEKCVLRLVSACACA